MKKILKKIIISFVKNNFMWFFLKPFSRLGIVLFDARIYSKKEKDIWDIEGLFFKNLVVQNGPFKRMRYPKLDSVGSAIYPKLLGCYEKELWETIEYFKKNEYTEIIDVGCAEGYYAVGLGMNILKTKIYAYDIDEKARTLCNEMAILNNVKDKIIIKSECTAKELELFAFTGRGLIICDCEGYEKELFNKDNVKNLINCDLIIEAHDFINISISTYLKEIFNETHNIKSIKSIDDIEKTITYNISGLEKLTLLEKKQVLSEWRPSIMEWLICTPKK